MSDLELCSICGEIWRSQWCCYWNGSPQSRELAAMRKYPQVFATMPEISPVPLLSPEGTGEAPDEAAGTKALGNIFRFAREECYTDELEIVECAEQYVKSLRSTVSRLTRERDEWKLKYERLEGEYEELVNG